MRNHEIDYKIYGEEIQCVEVELDPQETAVSESGSFMMMDEAIEMSTIFGDGSGQDKGFMGKIFSAGKRLLTGESLFITAFTNHGNAKAPVTFAAYILAKLSHSICPIMVVKSSPKRILFSRLQKAYLVGIEFQKKLGTGLFGGEGFIMQKTVRFARLFHFI